MKYAGRKLVISMLLLLGYIAMVVYEVNIGYMIVGLVVIGLIAFLWIPEIKGVSTKYFSLSKKIDEALVQYKEFKETVYPLLKLELANLASVGAFDAGPKSKEIVDFIERVEKLKITDKNMVNLMKVAKSQALSAFQLELKGMNPEAENFIGTGLDHDLDDYVITDNIYVDLEGLHNLSDGFDDIKTKIKYKRKLQELEEFYNENF